MVYFIQMIIFLCFLFSHITCNSSTSSQAVRHSARLRASQASQADSTIAQVDSEVSQANGALLPNSTASQATSNAGSQEAGAIPPTSNNNTQAGSSSGRGNRHSARLRAFQTSQVGSATSQVSITSSQGGNTSPQQ